MVPRTSGDEPSCKIIVKTWNANIYSMRAVKNILFLGDSLTAGYGLRDPERESFPALIQKRIDQEHLPYHVINAGLNGDTSSGGLSRVTYWLSRPVSIFVLELGINDIIRGIQPAVTLKNLNAIIRKVKSTYPEAKLVLMGMDFQLPFSHALISEFRSIFKKVADQHHMTYVPFFLEGVMGNQQLNLVDGLHPSAKGYEIMAKRIWPVLAPLL